LQNSNEFWLTQHRDASTSIGEPHSILHYTKHTSLHRRVSVGCQGTGRAFLRIPVVPVLLFRGFINAILRSLSPITTNRQVIGPIEHSHRITKSTRIFICRGEKNNF